MRRRVVKLLRALARRANGVFEKARDLRHAREVRIDDLQAVCIVLGPGRNLTTLTAAMASLHPECQVLNHAGVRIFGDPRVDFVNWPTPEVFRLFQQYAITISERGTGGSWGGSITHSHAFYGAELRSAFQSRGGVLIKPRIRALFWKEPLSTSARLQRAATPPAQLLERFPPLRFIQPFRDPRACARSNIETGLCRFIPGIKNRRASPDQVTTAILRQHAYFLDLQAAHPDRCFSYYGCDLSEQTLSDLYRFLGLEADPETMQVAGPLFTLRRDPDLEAFLPAAVYRRRVEEILGSRPDVAQAFLRFAPASSGIG